MCGEDYMATCSEDGSLRVWTVRDREQTLQFQVLEQVLVLSFLFLIHFSWEIALT